MTSLLSKLTSSALDLLFPLHCFGCQREGSLLCPQCAERLPKLEPPWCPLCAQPNAGQRCRWCRSHPPAVQGIRAPFLFQGPIREAVHALKFQGVRAAAPELGALLADYLSGHPLPADVIIPVPLHPRRLRSRGYNQSALLARQLGKLTGIAVEEKLLARTRDTPPQARATSREQRLTNVRDSFRCTADVAGRAVLLVDDVATTGSTLSACAAALKRGRVASVWGLTLARQG